VSLLTIFLLFFFLLFSALQINSKSSILQSFVGEVLFQRDEVSRNLLLVAMFYSFMVFLLFILSEQNLFVPSKLLCVFQQNERALVALQDATRLEPGNPQPKFTRGRILQKMGRLEEALEQFTAVRDFVPGEASVHIKMGEVCKQLGRIDEAMKHFTTALDLDPKDSNLIKAALDKLNEMDDHDDTL